MQHAKAEPPFSAGELYGRRMRWLKICFWVLAVSLGFIHAWADRDSVQNSDALSYLDMAGYFAQGNWANAVNAYWSPLYPLLLGAALRLVQPAPYREFALLHLVNWLIFVGALGCFEFLLHELLRTRHTTAASFSGKNTDQYNEDEGGGGFSGVGLMVLGNALFLWTALFLIRVRQESPDMLVAACLYVMAGLLLRIRRACTGWGNFLALGLICGIGYWSKAPLFVLAFVILAVALLAAGEFRRMWPRALAALILFLALCSPWMIAISQQRGRFTFGESGRLNFMWVINDVYHLHGQEGADVRGVFSHPPRKIFAHPAAYEFATPVVGTYPPWYDPSYWYDGAAGHFTLRGQLAALRKSAGTLYWLVFSDVMCGLLTGTLILWLTAKPRVWLAGAWQYIHLLVPALAGLAMFSLLHVQPRYVAPFLVLIWLAVWAGTRLPASETARRISQAATLVLAGLLLFSTVVSSTSEAIAVLRNLRAGADAAQQEPWQVTQGLRQFGVRAGDRVAVIGNAQRAFWARWGGTRIVADVPAWEAAAFWTADESVKAAVLAALGTTGAKVVVADLPSSSQVPSGWQPLPGTHHFVRILPSGQSDQ